MLPQLIKRRCPALADMCKAIVACPTGAIYFVADEQERLGGKILFNYERRGLQAIETDQHRPVSMLRRPEGR